MAPVPHGQWKTTTLVAALRTTGITAPYVLDGAMTGATFRAYVDQILAPTLSTGDTVVMDNLPCHHDCPARCLLVWRTALTLLTFRTFETIRT